LSSSLIEDISMCSYGPYLVEELLMAVSLWGQPGSKLMPPGLTQRYSWTAPYRSLWSHLITLSPWTNSKCTFPWAMAYTSVDENRCMRVSTGLHQGTKAQIETLWYLYALPLCFLTHVTPIPGSSEILSPLLSTDKFPGVQNHSFHVYC
jgi:hypothetical protein